MQGNVLFEGKLYAVAMIYVLNGTRNEIFQSIVHVSTAFANCPNDFIEEKIYQVPIDAEKLITLVECMEEKLIEEITPR